MILTARSSPLPVQQFLRDAGLPDVEVIAVGTADPAAKADYISGRIEGGVDHVEFFDDSHRNIRAVEALSALHPHARIVVRHVVH